MKLKIKKFGLIHQIRSYPAGFTLIEVLIVIALLVMLASMVLVATNESRISTQQKLTEATIGLLDTALQEYYDYTNVFPDPNLLSTSLPEPDYETYVMHNASLCFQLNSTPASKSVLEKITDSQKILIDNYLVIADAWGIPLAYLYEAGTNTFPVIISAGPDKNFGSADDITNKK